MPAVQFESRQVAVKEPGALATGSRSAHVLNVGQPPDRYRSRFCINYETLLSFARRLDNMPALQSPIPTRY